MSMAGKREVTSERPVVAVVSLDSEESEVQTTAV